MYSQPYTGSRTTYIRGNGSSGGLTNPVDYIQYKTAPVGVPTAEGIVSWNDLDKTLDVQLEGGSVLQVGQEALLRAVNNTGATIPNGSVVYISGSTGLRPQISLADADTITTSQAIGITTQDIAHNDTGYVTLIGLVRDVNTSGLTEGAPIFVSQTPGQFTTTVPSYPANVIPIGYIIRAHAVTGMLLVYVKSLGDTYKSITDSLDKSPEFLNDKITVDSTLAKTVVEPIVGDRKIQLGVSSSGGAAPYGQELWSYSTYETEESILRTGGSGMGDNSGTRAFAFIAMSTVTISKLRVKISQVGGSLMRLGLYDSLGNRIAQTAQFVPVGGILTVNLETPVQLSGGIMYYMAYWTNDTTGNLRFPLLSGRSTSTSSPLAQLSDFNDMPSTIGSSLTNSPLRPWLMISG